MMKVWLILALLFFAISQNVYAQIAPKPLYRDPIFDGATDPIIVYNRGTKLYEMFYTQRRANIKSENPRDVSWVHGTKIGIATSSDGANWQYVGAANLPNECAAETQWAPEIFFENGAYHMILTNVLGIFSNWNAPRYMTHLTSSDLRRWKCEGRLNVGSDRAIDAAFYRFGRNNYGLWFKDETLNSRIISAQSTDLKNWRIGGKILDKAGEGAKVFRFRGKVWLVYDSWRGLGVLQSKNGRNFQEEPYLLLADVGQKPTDRGIGNHADIIVRKNRAFIFYFVAQKNEEEAKTDPYYGQKSVIQIAEIKYIGGRLVIDRNETLDLRGAFK